MTQAPPFNIIGTTPNYQKQLIACLPSTAALPPLAAPTGTGNVPGAPAQAQAFARLSNGNYLVLNPEPSNPGSQLSVALFDSQLNFISQSQLPPQFAGLPILADVNGDGILDLVGLNVVVNGMELQGSATLVILLGQPEGSFEFKTSYQLTGTNFNSATFAVADINGDQKPDIVVASQGFMDSGGEISVFLGNGDGTFQPQRVVYSSTTTPYSVAIADLNGDGKADLAFTVNGGVAVALGNGDGTFAAPSTYPTLGTLSPIIHPTLTIGDVNGDGIPDIVTSGISILFGDGSGKFPKRLDYLVPYTGGGIILTDVDGNGGIDIVERAGNALIFSPSWILFDRGDGTYLGPKVSLTPTGILASADFNGDAIQDLVSLNASGVTALVGDGAGGFASAFQYPFNPGTPGALASIANSVVIGDFNNDGKLDFAVGYQTSSDSGTIAVFLGRGDGTFQTPLNVTVPPGVMALAAGDFNGDGKLDLAVLTSSALGLVTGNVTQDAVLILPGKGDGTFTSPVSYSSGPVASSIVVADFNRDGKLDIAVVNQGSEAGPSNIQLLIGKGDGTFSPGTSIAVPNLLGIAVGDFNGEGTPDLAVSTTSELVIFLGRGDATFARSAVYPVPQGAVLVADLNGDSRLDLIGNGYYLLGNGDGTFQPPVPLFGASSGFYAVNPAVAADLTQDGKIDLIGSTTLGVVSFLNISQQQPAVTIVSSASFAIGPVAPESLATAFGTHLAASTAAAPEGQAFPTTLAGTTVSVQDASGTTRPSELLYVSPGQVNFVVPAGTSSGTATVTITNQPSPFANVMRAQTAQAQIAPVAPGSFTLNAQGLVAGYATLISPGQPDMIEPVFTLENGTPTWNPISLGSSADQVYLTLFGTGWRNAGASGVSVDIQGVTATVSSAGAVSGIDGLDQVTFLIPHSFAGSGEVSIVVTAAGIAANTVYLAVQ